MLVRNKKNTRVSRLKQFFLPMTCVLCHAKGQQYDLCPPCYQELPWLNDRCGRCSLPLAQATAHVCGQCQHDPPYYNASVVLFHYLHPICHLINQFKFHQKLCYGHLLAELLIEKLHALPRLPELLLPVPLHPVRLRERGYNPALELTRPLAKAFHIKLNHRYLIRQRYTAQQSLIAQNQRQANVRHAFKLTQKITANHVGLVDDVITTGYTVNECSKVLKQQGVQTVTVLAVARTGYHQSIPAS